MYATDEGRAPNLAPALAELEPLGVPFVAPDALGDVLPKVTVAVLSPGIPLNGELVRRIQAAGVPVFSEVEVAYRICKAPIVALTGTKGKIDDDRADRRDLPAAPATRRTSAATSATR